MAHMAVNNKRRGHQAEIEAAAKIREHWPPIFQVERTGLDGGHDLRGPFVVGEVKAVRSGPEWLKSMLSQLDGDESDRKHFGLVKLSRGAGHPVRWLAVMDFEELSQLLHRASL